MFEIRKSVLLFLLACCSASCGLSVPNLEQPQCTEARGAVKKFYSYHFGNDMKPSKDNLQQHEEFLTPELFRNLRQQPDSAKDYFTQTDNYPKAFSVAGCELISPDKAVFDVLLFWKDDKTSEQREIKVETIKENNSWLINKVESK